MSTGLDKIVGNALKAALPAAKVTEAATLIKVAAGVRTGGAISAGTNPTSTSYPCQGRVVTTKREKIGGTLVEKQDRIVLLLGETLSGQRPTSKDRITIDGATQPIVDVEGSPAAWVCLCRG